MTTQLIEFPNRHRAGPYQAQSSTEGCDEVLSLVALSDDTVLAQIFIFGDGGEETARREAKVCLLAAAPKLLELADNVSLTKHQGGEVSEAIYQDALGILASVLHSEGDGQ
jgi:hypothetical protein